MRILARVNKSEVVGLKKKIVIILENNDLRNTIELIINGCGRYLVLGSFGSIEDSLEVLRKSKIDIIILDIDLQGMNGIQGAQRLIQQYPQLVILMYTINCEEESIFESLRAGVSGYMQRNADYLELVDALDEIAEGGTPMSREVIRKVINNYRINLNSPLSKRERQILSMLASGKTYTEISEELFISKETSKTHIRNIYTKMNVNRKSDAISKANDERWI